MLAYSLCCDPNKGQRMQFDRLKRREFTSLLGGAAAAWPLVARAQQPAVPVIGYLGSGFRQPHLIDGFQRGLAETGFAEGRNVVIEYRFDEGQYDRLPSLATELVGRQVAVLFAGSTTGAVLAAKAATTTIPIVFASGDDPIKAGLVASLNRPGGNVTGASFFTFALESKRLEMLHKLLPTAALVAVLVNPNFSEIRKQLEDIESAARAVGMQISILEAGTERDINAAFRTLVERRANALLVASDPFLFSRRSQLVALASYHALPTVYNDRVYVEAGGLISYGSSPRDAYRQAGVYVGQILKGTKPGDLPVLQPTKFELVINLKTVKALGLDVPSTLLALADEVIE
jgi:putative ABC transport system substrate-binding protein